MWTEKVTQRLQALQRSEKKEEKNNKLKICIRTKKSVHCAWASFIAVEAKGKFPAVERISPSDY